MSDLGNNRRLFRDKRRAMLFGVCAGFAEYFGFRLGAVRVLTVFALILFLPATLLIYFGMVLLLPSGMSEAPEEPEASVQKSVRAEPEAMLSSARHRYRELELRLQRLEKYLTSERYRLDREFEALRD